MYQFGRSADPYLEWAVQEIARCPTDFRPAERLVWLTRACASWPVGGRRHASTSAGRRPVIGASVSHAPQKRPGFPSGSTPVKKLGCFAGALAPNERHLELTLEAVG